MRLLSSLKDTTDKIACGSPLYDWSLSGLVPERLAVKPVDCWPGNEQAGRALCAGIFTLEGDQLEFHGHDWEPEGAGDLWLTHMHGFSWLRDLRTIGGDNARKQARALIENWTQYYDKWHPLAWRPDVTGSRVAMWISHYEIFIASADEEFQYMFLDSLSRQARHLSKALPGNLLGLRLLQALRGLIYCGLAFDEHERWIEQGLVLLEDEIARQILSDGGHVSRSPQQLLEALQILLDIRIGLKSGGYPVPEEVQHAIDKMAPALRFFRYNDKGLALFNGAQKGHIEAIDAALLQSNARGKALQSLPHSGYERMQVGRGTIIMDTGSSPAHPYDAAVHAAPLAFEFVFGKDRVLTACGTHPCDETWREALRATAAHTALSIDHRNAAEIGKDGHVKRGVKNVVALREDSKTAGLLESSHDGYGPVNGISHRRRLYLSDKGHDLRGEETLSSAVDVSRAHDIAARFHLHPRVMVSLVKDGEEALLRLPSGVGWRFQSSLGTLSLEESIYLGEGAVPRKTKQIVIYGRMTTDKATIKWALRREG